MFRVKGGEVFMFPGIPIDPRQMSCPAIHQRLLLSPLSSHCDSHFPFPLLLSFMNLILPIHLMASLLSHLPLFSSSPLLFYPPFLLSPPPPSSTL